MNSKIYKNCMFLTEELVSEGFRIENWKIAKERFVHKVKKLFGSKAEYNDPKGKTYYDRLLAAAKKEGRYDLQRYSDYLDNYIEQSNQIIDYFKNDKKYEKDIAEMKEDIKYATESLKEAKVLIKKLKIDE